MKNYWQSYKNWAKKISQEVKVIYFAYHHPKTPWYAKVLMAIIIFYAACPIDIIPDFIPVLGLLDDMIIIPLGIYWSFKLIPPEIIGEAKLQAGKIVIKTNYWLMILVIGIWLMFGWWIFQLILKAVYH